MYPAFRGEAIGVHVGFEEAVELAAHYKFEGIYVDIPYLKEVSSESVGYLLDQRGLRAAGWILPVGLLAPEEDFADGLKRLPAVAEACSHIRALRCITWIPPASNDLPYQQMFDLLVGRLQKVCAILKENDVRLGLEFIGPATSRAGKRYEFIHTMDGMLELCEAVGTGNVGLLLDCWHLYTSGGKMDDVLKLTDAQVVDVHVNDAPAGVPREDQIDNVRRLPGQTGVIDVRRFLECLQQIGYTGPVMCEPFYDPLKAMDKDEAIRTVKEALDSVWPA